VRFPQLRTDKTKGSQKLIQDVINDYPEVLNNCIRKKISSLFDRKIIWISPLKQEEKAHIEAYLVFLYFVEDGSHIRTSQTDWNSALKLQKKLMGLSANSLTGKVTELFIETEEIRTDSPLSANC